MGALPSPVLLGIIGAAHGVKGEVRIRSYTADPVDIRAYGALTSADGRRFEILAARMAKDVVVARLKGVANRDAAEALNGIELFVDRSLLPEPEDEDEFLHADLIGLRAEAADGTLIGKVTALHNFGGGDTIEIHPQRGPSLLLPFTKLVVPVIDIAGGRIVVALPDETEVPGV